MVLLTGLIHDGKSLLPAAFDELDHEVAFGPPSIPENRTLVRHAVSDELLDPPVSDDELVIVVAVRLLDPIDPILLIEDEGIARLLIAHVERSLRES